MTQVVKVNIIASLNIFNYKKQEGRGFQITRFVLC